MKNGMKVFLGVLLLSILGSGSVYGSDVKCENELAINNQSGWPITVIYTMKSSGDEKKEIPMPEGEEFKLIGCLQDLTSLSFKRRGTVWGLGAKERSLKVRLFSLKGEAIKYPEKRAEITINSIGTKWKTSEGWSKNGNNIKEMPETEFYVTLKNVKEGVLGENFMKAVNKIINADYSNAEKKGYVNLSKELVRKFSKITVGKGVPAKGTTGKDTYKVLKPTKKLYNSEAKKIIIDLNKKFNDYQKEGVLKK